MLCIAKKALLLACLALMTSAIGCGTPPPPTPPPANDIPIEGLKLELVPGDIIYPKVFVYNGGTYVVDSIVLSVELASGETREMLARPNLFSDKPLKPRETQERYPFTDTGFTKFTVKSARVHSAKGWSVGEREAFERQYEEWELKHGAEWARQHSRRPK